ncbi:brain and acute leukemia cytoplasmic protein [Alligator mississippiensis]|uniref:brain and acute leukemia cytoplasmic protein n=1 Tax=Alligator mississippiensis TaxID=8496 RepID=UPI0028772CCE|nr:brain and acute leukemia cytoplasmic protein [Alligator mississippiensis]
MGCGGSRADAIEPRYYESWTRETESTWLTNTDSDGPAQEGGAAEPGAGILEEGKSTQTCVTMSSSACGMLNTEKKASCGTQCSKSTLHATGTMTQKQHGFRTAEAKWDTKKMPTKEVAINVTKSIRQINSDRRTTKNCVN